MPYKTDKMRLDCPFLDRRCKLLPCQKEMVVHYSNQGYSQRKLAKMFNVSRRLIAFIANPEQHKNNLERRRERGGSAIYYKGGYEWAKVMREHRRYKHKTLTKNF